MQDDNIKRRNDAIVAGRLFSGSVQDRETERCHHCGELLHPFPEPEYWMQYPLPTCCVLDGLKFCDDYRKPDCIAAYLVANPTPPEATTPAARRRTKVRKSKPQIEDKDARIAALAATLPEDRAGLLAVAADAVAAVHEAVLNRADLVADVAGDRYAAAVWKLNGGTFFGCAGDEDAAERVIERHCRATPGVVPMWGQEGDFLASVDGMRVWVEVENGYGGLTTVHFQFHAVDLDGPFISETGYRSHFDHARGGMTVDQVADGVLRALLRSHRRYLDPRDQDRLADDSLPAWLAGITPPPRRVRAVAEDWRKPDELPPGFAWVDAVLPAHQAFIARKWAASAKAKLAAARAKAQEPAGQRREPATPAKPQPEPAKDEDAPAWPATFFPGLRCEIVSVHHPVFAKEIGKHVIITKISPETRQVWAHDDKPARYRINRNGRKVCEYDPRCIESCYGYDQLRAAI
ncbi:MULTISPECIES: klcB [Pseudomonadota]|uniref:klcB n=1 Tax=Pseudomonadota TaxID=1224 RepID=UPI002FEA51D0